MNDRTHAAQSETPLTDAIAARDWKRTSYTKAGELEKLARRLERERAELIAALASIANANDPSHPKYGENWRGLESEFSDALISDAAAALAKVRP